MARSSSSSSTANPAGAGQKIQQQQSVGRKLLQEQQQQQQQQYVGRKLLQARASYDAGGSIYAALQKESTGLYRETAGATDAASLQGKLRSCQLALHQSCTLLVLYKEPFCDLANIGVKLVGRKLPNLLT
jgi:hypothetical protein